MSIELIAAGVLGYVFVIFVVMSLLVAAKRGDEQMSRRPRRFVRGPTRAAERQEDEEEVAPHSRAS